MKRIIISVLFSICLLIGGILFVFFNHKSKTIETKGYCVVKFENVYPFELTFPKHTQIKTALESIGIFEVKQIYELNKIKSINDFISSDTTYKVIQ